METDAHSRGLLSMSFRNPSKGALPPGPPDGVPLERDAPFLEPFLIQHSKFPVYEPPPSWFQVPLRHNGAAMEREMPVSRAFLNISSRVPSNGAPPQGPLHWAPSEIDAAFLEPPSRFPSRAPMERDAHLQSLFTYPPRTLAREPSLHSPFQPSLKAHSRLSSWAPMKRDACPQNLPFIIQGPQ